MQRVKDEIFRLYGIEATPSEIDQIIRSYMGVSVKIDSAEIMKAVCRVFKVTEKEITGKSRKKPLPTARKVFCYLASAHSGWNEASIGRLINRDRTTVYVHVKEVASGWKFIPKEAEKLNEVAIILGLPKQLTIVNGDGNL